MAINENSVVSMEYQVMEADTKNVVDSNVGQDPLEFIIGKGQIIPGLESELMKLDAGEKADVIVAPENAYGEYNEEAVQTLPKEQFAGIELKEGMTLYGSGEGGQTVQVVVKSFNDEEVNIDYNHPLAGKTLMFTVTIMGVRAATEEEIATGIVGGMASAGGCCGGGHCDSDHDHGHKHEHKHDEGGCCGGGHCS
jgi:FKBP-type peptidyl-prolyl cis-trans isomerase SlyD